MTTSHKPLAFVSVLLTVAILAACGGGGGGSTINNPPTPHPSPASSPALNGMMQVASGSYPAFSEAAASNASLVFSCGCNPQAGTSTTSNSGVFTLVANSTPTPSVPNPIYTIAPGRNYIEVATTAAGAEAWNLQFAGSGPGRNQYLNGPNTSDVYAAAVSLYVYQYSLSGSTAFDNWNFNVVRNWYNILAGGAPGPNASEQKLLNDIAAAGNGTLYPTAPTWDPKHGTNPTIKGDLSSVKASGDKNVPTPCPAGCTGTPTP